MRIEVDFRLLLEINFIRRKKGCILQQYLIGMIITIVFYKLIPQGADMLKRIGVQVFDMGIAGIRFSPLTDDPNYGAALIILIAFAFILSKKTQKQSKRSQLVHLLLPPLFQASPV